MLCYRCGTYSPDGSRQCIECGEAFSPERRRSSPAGLPSGRSEASDKPPFAVGQVVAEHYRLKEVIARGASGWVMRARDEGSETDVAIKILDPNLLNTETERADFLRVAKKTIKIHHPNVVRVFQVGTEGDLIFYTMTYLEGLTLRKIIDLRAEKKQVFSFSEAIPLVNQLAEGVQGLSKLKFHGALSPNNVLVLPDILKITGVSHFHGLPHSKFIKRLSNRPGGAYLSPEAKDSINRVSLRSDVYSIAAIFAEMTIGVVYGQDIEEWERVISRLEPAMRKVLERALSPKASERYSSAVKFVDALLDAVGEEDYPVIELEPDEETDAESVELSSADVRSGEVEVLSDDYDAEINVSSVDLEAIEVEGAPTVVAGSIADLPPVDGLDENRISTDIHAQLGGEVVDLTGSDISPVEGSIAEDESELVIDIDESISDERRLPSFSGVASTKKNESNSHLIAMKARRSAENRSAKLLIAAVLLAVLGVSAAFLFRSETNSNANSSDAVAIGIPPDAVHEPGAQEAIPATDVPILIPEEADSEKGIVDPLAGANPPVRGPSKTPEPVVAKKEPAPRKPTIKLINSEAALAETPTKPVASPVRRPIGYTPPVAAAMIPKPAPAPPKEPTTVAAAFPPPPPIVPEDRTCPGGMIKLDPGSFLFGSSASDPLRGFGDLNAARVQAHSFCVDIYEYPNSRGRSPTVNVTWTRAKGLCEKRGKRLCTEKEWERACKGPRGARFPTGSEPAPGVCNISSEDGETGRPETIGSYPECRSGFGVADMAGNVAEWTASNWSLDIPDRVVKGGAADQASYTARCSARSNESSGARQSNLGFRCCKDI